MPFSNLFPIWVFVHENHTRNCYETIYLNVY
jgi:hypothetical protein